jgi:methionine-rich copper-binding protein CopC
MKGKFMKNLNTFKLLSVLGALFLGSTAHAHAHLKESTPKPNIVLHAAPTEVQLTFSENLESSMSKIEVINAVTKESVTQGKLEYVGEKKNTVRVELKKLTTSAKYEVHWKAVSKDTHKMEGQYEFVLSL